MAAKVDPLRLLALIICRYQLADFRGDLLAGVTVAAVLIPQGMSYSVLAGLPPIYGLFAGLMPMFSYSFFGAPLPETAASSFVQRHIA